MPAPAGLVLVVHRLPADDPSRPLRLRYLVAGDPAAVRWPRALAAGEEPRRDGLGRHTCFEAFVAAPAGCGSGYVEYNFAPSGAWAIICQAVEAERRSSSQLFMRLTARTMYFGR